MISIHALREEGDRRRPRQRPVGRISIHALREEGDRSTSRRPQPPSYFYPRPPRGGRLTTTRFLGSVSNFYPRPPRGGRRRGAASCLTLRVFLSTPSARRATPGRGVYPEAKPEISIHALREEGDGVPLQKAVVFQKFLSTPSARRATVCRFKRR